MGLSVSERGSAVATFRYIHVELMQMLAQWTPSTPEMEVKLMFGEHIWDVAQHADALGKRAPELRLPPQHSLKPADPYLQLLGEVRKETGTARRLAAFYDALLPGLAHRYRGYLGKTDTLMDAPTVRILEAMLQTQARMIEQCGRLREEFPALRPAQPDTAWREALASQDRGLAELVAAGGG
jgi:hypothetical protein